MAQRYKKYTIQQRHGEAEYLEMFMGLLPKGLLWVFDRMLSAELIQDVSDAGANEWQDVVAGSEIQDTTASEGYSGNLLKRLMSCFASEAARLEADAVRLLNETDPGVSTDILTDWERNLGLPEACFAGLTSTWEERQIHAHVKLFETNRTMTRQAYIDYAASLGFDIDLDPAPYAVTPRIMGVARMGVERMGGYGAYSIMKVTVNSGTPVNLLKCAFSKVKQAHVKIIYEIL